MPSVAACIGPKQGSSISHWAFQDLRQSFLWIQNCTVCSLEDCKLKHKTNRETKLQEVHPFSLRCLSSCPLPSKSNSKSRSESRLARPLAEVPKMDTENFLSSMQPVDSGSTLWWYFLNITLKAAKASSLQVIINYIIQYKWSIRTTSKKKGMLTFWHLDAVKN